MRNALLSLAVAAAGSYFYMQHPKPAAGTLPEGHRHAPEGVYYLRTAYTVPTAAGPVQWTSGQTLYADTRVQMSPNSNTIAVTDGTHTAQVLGSLLSQDVDEGTGLQTANANADAAARVRAEQDRIRADMHARLAVPAPTYVSPLEQSSQRVGHVYYSPGYSTTVINEVRSKNPLSPQGSAAVKPVLRPPPVPLVITH